MTEPDYTNVPFEARYQDTGIETIHPRFNVVIAVLDTVEGELYIFAQPPYEKYPLPQEHCTPSVLFEQRCLKFMLHNQAAVDEAMAWSKYAVDAVDDNPPQSMN